MEAPFVAPACRDPFTIPSAAVIVKPLQESILRQTEENEDRVHSPGFWIRAKRGGGESGWGNQREERCTDRERASNLFQHLSLSFGSADVH